VDFLHLMSQAHIVLTDSGGIQEETSYLGIPCLTLRQNTERPITVEMGTNTLIGQDTERLAEKFHAILDGDFSWDKRPPEGIPLWDGHTAERIVKVLRAF
jgi:UDP-N-acetylglucosamine 2-epimerase (non-hydrolysing)